MGVYGLWKLLEASGKQVPLESLEGKVLAIDISIWIYQVLQGYQDRHGVSRPNAHLLGLFTRICKLLYYKIKPVFVFDGGVPMLKKNTIVSRRKQKSIATSKAQKMKADLMNNLIKHRVVKTVLNEDSKDRNSEAIQMTQTKHSNQDMFALPDMPSVNNLQNYLDDDQDDSDSSVQVPSPRKQSKWMGNIHNVDVTGNEFKALPADVRYDILTDLKETRKQNSWGRLHEMPQESQEFSGFQLKRLLKRRHVQASLESAEKEMGGKTLTLEELDKLLTEQGVDTKSRDATFRIAADSTTRLIYISDKNALAKKSLANEIEPNQIVDTLQDVNEEIEPVAGPSNPMPIVENINEYELNNSDSENDVSIYDDALPIAENISEYTFDSEWESENDINESLTLEENMINPALTYMLEYSDLSQNQIMQLIQRNKDESRKTVSKDINDTTKRDIYNLELAKQDDKSIFPKNCEQVLKSVESQSMKDACIPKENLAAELISSSPESDNLTQVKPLENNVKTSNITVTSDVSSLDKGIISDKHSLFFFASKSNNVIQIDTSDSDSDDFIEIQDVPIHDMNISRNITKKKDIEITFKIDKKLEDDIFADIFRKVNKEKVVPVSPEQEQFVDTINREQQTQLISENSGKDSIILDTMYGESIREKTKTELPENIELSKNIPDDEDRVCDIENSSKSIEHCTDTPIRLNPLEECIQEKPQVLPANKEDLIELKGQLEDQQEELARDIGKLERQATSISEQIKTDAQDLLRLFGIPYIIAPMEAEAQCAYLEQIKLTDGTITDDSDIWLFGGQCVYKNFFNHSKRMLRFHACDIQHHFKLNRNQLIQLALLVGSDYTTGVAGVGPVTALEILAAFPSNGDNVLHGLHNFCSWIKKGMFAAPGKTGLRNKLRSLRLNKDFPNQAIVQAYLFPTVDESKEIFTWDKPNVVLLCDYTRQKFGWTKGKFDDTMIPVLRRMEENKNQKLLDMYFKAKASPRSIESSLSKRVQKALRRLNSDDVDTDSNIDGKSQLKKSKKDDAVQKSNKEKNSEFEFIELETSTGKNKNAIHERERPIKVIDKKKYNKEYIPQREKDKESALERKLHAIEIFRKSKRGLSKTKKVKCKIRKVKEQAELSESDSN